jgi:hypothetical protein
MTIDTSSGIVVRDSTFTASGACGIDIEPISGENPTAVSIFNCQITSNANMGLQSGPDDVNDTGTFTNSVFAFNTISGTNIGIYQGNSNGISILNNTISNINDKTEEDFAACGIMLNDSTGTLGVTNGLIFGNTISSVTSNGIYFLNCHNTEIGYNTITNCGGYGIANMDNSATVEHGTNTGSGNTKGNTNGSAF